MPTALTRSSLRAPKAAAIAGIVFSLLTTIVFGLLWTSIPAGHTSSGGWVAANSNTVALALNLTPFAGIAFLWFMGVIRDRLGEREDKFFATVFFGSGLLFLGMLFFAAADLGAILTAFSAEPEFANSDAFSFAGAVAYSVVNIYMVKMAAVFMISTSTVAISTRFATRWIAVLGYALALLLLFGSYYIRWSFVVFPFWVLLLSVHLLLEGARRSAND